MFGAIFNRHPVWLIHDTAAQWLKSVELDAPPPGGAKTPRERNKVFGRQLIPVFILLLRQWRVRRPSRGGVRRPEIRQSGVTNLCASRTAVPKPFKYRTVFFLSGGEFRFHLCRTQVLLSRRMAFQCKCAAGWGMEKGEKKEDLNTTTESHFFPASLSRARGVLHLLVAPWHKYFYKYNWKDCVFFSDCWFSNVQLVEATFLDFFFKNVSLDSQSCGELQHTGILLVSPYNFGS